jgi:heme/copper-type cytochrome/quinol oxidase subunit 2
MQRAIWVYHGFMPIVIEAVPLEKYIAWLSSQIPSPQTLIVHPCFLD